MGIFDLPAPFLQFIDNGVAFLPAIFRLTLWSALAGVLSMALYALVSPQKKISTVKIALRKSQGILAESDESFTELLTVVRKTLSLSFQHLGLVLGPALLSSLPLICIMAWTSSQFGHVFPEAGDRFTLSARPESAAASFSWQMAGVTAPIHEAGIWTAEWPNQSQRLVLNDKDDSPLLEIPLVAPIPQIHKRLWWNSLLGNPAGYLPDQSSVDLIRINLPARQYLPFGPDWVGNWLTLFLIASVSGALLTKKIFKIH